MPFFIFFTIATAAFAGSRTSQNEGDGQNSATSPRDTAGASLTDFDPESQLELNYDGWDRLLSHAVKTPDELNRPRSSVDTRTTGSRLGGGGRRRGPIYDVNMVNYSGLGENFRAALGELLDEFSRVPVSRLNRDEQLAYWLNLHNAAFLAALIDHYPIEDFDELMDAEDDGLGLLDMTRVQVGEFGLSLREIRENILAVNWDTPLIVYGLFTGTEDGPNMSPRAYTGENVYALLEESAREFVNDNRGVRVRRSRPRASEIYEWPSAGIEGRDELLQHLRRFGDPGLRRDLRDAFSVGSLDFDWELNELPADMTGTDDAALATYSPPPLMDGDGAD